MSKENNSKGSEKKQMTALSAGLAIPVVTNASSRVRGLLANSVDRGFDGLEKETREINKKLLHGLKRGGYKVISREGNNASIATLAGNQGGRDVLAGVLKELPKPQRKVLARIITRRIPLGAVGRNAVIMGKDISGATQAPVLAHELGHKHYDRSRANKIGEISHRAYGKARIATTLVPSYGYVNGVRNARKEGRGEKLSTWDKTKSVAVPLALAAPILVAEGAASARGIKILKEAGASKKLLKASKKSLAKAHGTYAIWGTAAAATGGLSEQVGRRDEEKRLKRKREQAQ